MDELSPEQRAAAEGLEAELALAAEASIIGETGPDETLAVVAEQSRRQLAGLMRRMGFPDEDVERAEASVTAKVDADAIVVTWQAPDQVAAYMEAIKHEDYDRAAMLLDAREG